MSEFGPKINIKDDSGRTPLYLAVEKGQIEIVRLPSNKFGVKANDNNGETPLHFAAKHGNLEVMKSLVRDFGADPNVVHNDGWTPLHFATQNANLEMVRLLVAELGANAHASDANGRTPLYEAMQRGHVEIVGLLDVKKADGKLRNAIAKGNVNDVKLFMQVVQPRELNLQGTSEIIVWPFLMRMMTLT